MKKIKDAKKLQLNTETIATLTPDEEAAVVGGQAVNAADNTSTLKSSCNVICTDVRCCPQK